MHRIEAEMPENIPSYEKSNFVLENLLIKPTISGSSLKVKEI